MYVTDFEYDGTLLSSFGLMICSFDGTSNDSISNGSEITFNTVPFAYGMEHKLTSTTYEQCLTSTFSICKNPCADDEGYLDFNEIRILMNWLNRKNFHTLRFLQDDYINLTFNGSFQTINRIENNGKVIGLELTVVTDKPFGYGRTILKNIRYSDRVGDDYDGGTWKFTIGCDTDEETKLYPRMVITMESAGDLEIYNKFDDSTMKLKNCKANEVISLNYPLIESNDPTHKIQNDFNWNWFGICSSYKSHRNDVTVSLPCNIEIEYQPIIKMGLI